MDSDDRCFKIEQIKKAIELLNTALAHCYSLLAELERPLDEGEAPERSTSLH